MKSPAFFTDFTDNQSMFYVLFMLFTSGPAWFCIILATVVSLIPDICLKVLENFIENQKLKKLKENFKKDITLLPFSETQTFI